MNRRTFLSLTGGASITLLASKRSALAQSSNKDSQLIPADKRLGEEWLRELTARGEPEILSGDDLKYIGMPVGGLCAGLVYMGGDGKLWLWDIFNRNTMEKKASYGGKTFGNRDGSLYVSPLIPKAPFAQGFAIKYRAGSSSGQKTLDNSGGWQEITFHGTYPMATIRYQDPELPVTVKLEAFSPFIPLNADDSSLPATVMRYTFTNSGNSPSQIEIAGWLENTVLTRSASPAEATRRNETIEGPNTTGLIFRAHAIEQSDTSAAAQVPITERNDFGTMALVLVNPPTPCSTTKSLLPGEPAQQAFAHEESSVPSNQPVGAVRASLRLESGASATVTYLITWHFPNVDPKIDGANTTHYYSERFGDAGAVAHYIAANYQQLYRDTATWCETWNDSTLPHWFLNRSFSNICNLATTTSYRFKNGQFWSWEGIYACEGTCTHVWSYAQGMARIFPELERTLREKTDYAFALDQKTGVVNFRGTHGGFAADGQAGIILRTYREHLTSPDESFLKALWPRVRLVMDRIIAQGDARGLLDGPQPNTLDTAWHGEIAWISGLYLAALRAAEEMARDLGDTAYAQKCRNLFSLGAPALVSELFNGEYFFNKVDPHQLDAINSGTGCEIDQLRGQGWAWQIGLGRIFPQVETGAALKSLYRYNFTPDAGGYHNLMKVGRWYAMPGESGLLLCTFPRSDWTFQQAAGKGPQFAIGYFNECMSGFEHEAASLMIAEGLVQEGLTVTRAIHDRYSPAKRNPYNEIECGDHYSRALASYASFISISGFEYNGPAAHIGFSPRLTPEDFRCAFTAAEGWGTFWQKLRDSGGEVGIEVRWGKLRLKTISVGIPRGDAVSKVTVSVGGNPVQSAFARQAFRGLVTLDTEQILLPERHLLITFT